MASSGAHLGLLLLRRIRDRYLEEYAKRVHELSNGLNSIPNFFTIVHSL